MGYDSLIGRLHMSRTCLLAVATLLCLGAGQTFAQSPQTETSSSTKSQTAGPLNSHDSSINDQSSAKDDSGKAQSQSSNNLMGLLDAEQNRARFIPGAPSQADVACFSIRSYRVVRDDPHSDSTHRDGYTTCVPAERFKVHTSVEHVR
jgi:hypothetical protein